MEDDYRKDLSKKIFKLIDVRKNSLDDVCYRKIKYALEVGNASIEEYDENKESFLTKASKIGDVKLIEIFIKAKCGVNLYNLKGETPLIAGVKNGDRKVVEKLIENGADVNLCEEDVFANSPLMVAIKNKYFEIAKLIIEKGGKVDYKNGNKETPLMTALWLEEDCLEFVKYLVEKGGEVNGANVIGLTPLMIASKYKSKETVEYLLEKGAKPDEIAWDGQTALKRAAKGGNSDVVKVLAEAGANIDFCDKKNHESALLLAVKENHYDVVEYLLKKGANKDIIDDTGNGLLHYASCAGECSMAKLLIEYGVGKNKRNYNWHTPLMTAIFYDKKDVVELLLEKGADIYLRDRNGDRAKDIAKINHKDEIVKLIEKKENIMRNVLNKLKVKF